MRLCIASVNYGDHLALTLPLWVALVGSDAVTVVTSAEDIETQDVARAAGVRVLVTDAWTRHDPTFTRDVSHWHAFWQRRGEGTAPEFNKALALDEAFGFACDRTPAPLPGEICIAVDADCRPVGTLPYDGWFDPDAIYGCRRYHYLPGGGRGAEMKIFGRALKCQHKSFPPVMEGCFQLFRYRPGLRFGSYPGADGYDSDFAEFNFALPGREIPGFSVLHHGGMGETHTNWRGRKTARFEERA